MANADGDKEGGPGEGRPPAWSGSSTPPDVYGNFDRPSRNDDSMHGAESEPTIEDVRASGEMWPAHGERQNFPELRQDLEESGDYDIRALAPLRHLLEQDWTDPNVRSRLQSRSDVPEHGDDSAAVVQSTQPWFASFKENAATAETISVPTVQTPVWPGIPGSTGQNWPVSAELPPAPPEATSPAETAPPEPLAQVDKPTMVGASTGEQARPWSPAGSGSVQSRVSTPAVGPVGKPSLPSSPAKPQSVGVKPPVAFAAEPSTPQLAADFAMVFDEEEDAGAQQLRSKAAKNVAKAPSRAKKVKVSPWLLAAGAALIIGAFAVPESVFAGAPAARELPRLVLSSTPRADVYRGEELIGQTPLVLDAAQVGEGLTLASPGFESLDFRLEEPLTESLVAKHEVVLAVAPTPLDWTGLPSETKLTWQGKPATVSNLTAVTPGTYAVGATAPNRPAVTLSLLVPSPADGVAPTPVTIGKQLEAAFSKQPALSMSIKTGKGKSPKLPLTVTISQAGQKPFSKTASLDGKASSKLVLPAPGTYQVKVPASATHKAFSKTLALKEGASQSLEIALIPVPPKIAAVSAPPRGSGGGGGGGAYVPPPAYYAPPPVYYSGGGGSGGGGGGGGGGGRIAPPSF